MSLMLRFFKRINPRRPDISESLSASLSTGIIYVNQSRSLEWRLYFIAIETMISSMLSFLILVQDYRTIQMDNLLVQSGVTGPLIPLLYRTSSLGFLRPRTNLAEFIILFLSALAYVLGATYFFLNEFNIPEVAEAYLNLWHSIAYLCILMVLLISADLFLLARDSYRTAKSRQENEA